MEKCKAITKKKNQCSRNAKENGYCGQHKNSKESKIPKSKIPESSKESKIPKSGPKIPKEPKISIRLPENISEKLANSSQVGLNKIKEQIIQMWLEDGGSVLTLLKYNNRIPVDIETYKQLLKIFNNEEVVLQQMFVTELPKSEGPKDSKESKGSKPPPYSEKSKSSKIPTGSTNPPKVPIKITYYSDFIPKEGNVMSPENQKAFQTLKKFIQDQWLKSGEILHQGFIYLTSKTYKNAENYLRTKIQEVNSIYKIDVKHWTSYLMDNIFKIGTEPKENPKVPKSEGSKENPKVPKSEGSKENPKISKPEGPVHILRKIQRKDIQTELTKLFPEKDTKVFMDIIVITSSSYKVNSKVDIMKLYMLFHPDKCDNNPKVLKLCNTFCAKVENIKKIWEHSKNPKAASPLRVQGDDTETILRILNDEV